MGIYVLGILVFFVVGEAFVLIMNRLRTKELNRYNAKNSDVYYQDADEFIAKLRSAVDLGVTNVEYDGDKVKVICQNNTYDINLNDGVASIEYDKKGLEYKVSTIGKIFRMTKISKLTKKAICINTVMDYVSGKDYSQAPKKYNKIKVCNIGIISSIALIAVFMLMMALSFVNQRNGKLIEKVKNIEYYESYTCGDVIDGYIKDADWTTFADKNNTPVVEINGTSVKGEKLRIQFSGDYNGGMEHIDDQEFGINYFEIDGESTIPDEGMMYMLEYVYSNVDIEEQKDEQTDNSENASSEEEVNKEEVAEEYVENESVEEDVSTDVNTETNTETNVESDSAGEVNTDVNAGNESSEPVIEEENIFVFYNYAGDSMIALAEYNTPASDGAIGEVVQSYNDEVTYSAKYYLDTSGTSCWAEDYEVLYYFYDEQDFIQYLGINPSEEGAIMDYNSEYRNNDIYYEMIE